jgi:hypothetical protein
MVGEQQQRSSSSDDDEEEDDDDDDRDDVVEDLASKGYWNGYYFDSLALIENKVKYSVSRGLAGVYVWEVGQDVSTESFPGGILLEAAAGVQQGMMTIAAKKKKSEDTSHDSIRSEEL